MKAMSDIQTKISGKISIEQSVIDRVNELRAKKHAGFESGSFLRIAVVGGGCSGFKYVMEPDSTVNADDTIFGDAVVMDEISQHYMKGSVISFEKGMLGAAFAIDNPNARSSCGCQTSFSIDPSALEDAG